MLDYLGFLSIMSDIAGGGWKLYFWKQEVVSWGVGGPLSGVSALG